jgi:NADPH2:quinone reductase
MTGAGRYKAAVCQALEGPGAVRIVELERKPLKPGEVRLRIHAAGVNFPDLLMTRGGYQFKAEPPYVPGMEAAGEVIETTDAARAPLGRRVCVGNKTGLFAEETVVTVASLRPWPAGFSAAEAATFSVAAVTADHALVNCARLEEGETLLVLGAGSGVGLGAVEIGAALGARVIAVASSEAKRAAALAKGASAALGDDPRALRAAVDTIAGRDGTDIVFDPVGGRLGEAAFRTLGHGGRFLVIGFASGEVPVLPANHALIRCRSIIGVRAGEARRQKPEIGAAASARIAAWCAEGRLKPVISHRAPLEGVVDLLEAMGRREIVGRAVLEIGP